ncbi:MAG: hypothetical protein JST92_03465 [Deltaproteobacteria bacterium]|nr:hypothetical protein [Deltaproteobacteria bacterium]
MTRTLATAALALCALALAPAARADGWGIRAGLEAPLVTRVNDAGSYNIGDSIQPGLDVLVLKGPSDFIALGGELNVGFASTSNFERTGTTIGPTLLINIPVLPLYARAALPIRVEPNGVALGLRLAAGLKFSIPIVGIYLEAFGDMPLADKVDAFSYQRFGAGAGVQLSF